MARRERRSDYLDEEVDSDINELLTDDEDDFPRRKRRPEKRRRSRSKLPLIIALGVLFIIFCGLLAWWLLARNDTAVSTGGNEMITDTALAAKLTARYAKLDMKVVFPDGTKGETMTDTEVYTALGWVAAAADNPTWEQLAADFPNETADARAIRIFAGKLGRAMVTTGLPVTGEQTDALIQELAEAIAP